MNPHPYKLRPYHNPEGVDESKVPDGWRFRYADDAGTYARSDCRAWLGFDEDPWGSGGYDGNSLDLTYIVPVSS